MAFCPKCGTEIQSDATSCPACGIVFTPAEVVDSNDRTAEFTAKDISENKVFALVAYAFGFIGSSSRCSAPKTHPLQHSMCVRR